MKKIGIALFTSAVIVSALFFLLTLPVTYEVEPDGSYRGAKATDIKRPFYVDRNEYPFASNWLEYNGATMHYLFKQIKVQII